MNIILGATGQVGSMLAAELLERGEPVILPTDFRTYLESMVR